MAIEVRSFHVHQEGAGPGRLVAERPFELVILLGRARRARPADDASDAAADDEPPPDEALYDASADRTEEADGVAGAGTVRVDLTVEAFAGDDPATAPRLQLLRTRVLAGRHGAGRQRVRWGLPAEVERVRFRLTAREVGHEDEQVEALLPQGPATLAVAAAADRTHEGEVDEAPSIYEVLQHRPPSASSGEGAAGVVDHVVAQLRDLPAFFARALGEPPYAPLPGELGPDGQPATGLAAWQRQVIERMTGAFYAYAPRRVTQHLAHGVGHPLTSVCNNNVDLAAWLRGAEVPGWERGGGSGFNCNGRSPDLLAGALGVRVERDPPGEAPTGAFVHDFRTARTDDAWIVDEGFRQWSFEQARPGSIFVYADVRRTRDPDQHIRYELDGAHINYALRVRRIDGRIEVQLFDTGAVEATDALAPRALGEFGKALSEGGWQRDLNREFGRASGEAEGHKKCIAHAWFPPAGDRSLPAWPLWSPTSLPDARGCAIATTRDRAYRGRRARKGPPAGFDPIPDPDYPASVAEPTWIADTALWLLPDARYPGYLREVASRPLLHLAITRRADGALVHLSRPLRCSRPITHLLGAVADLPASGELEARWLLLAIGTWPQYLAQGFEPPEHPRAGTPLYVALQVANDAAGVARLIRPQKALDDPAFADRLPAVWEAGMSRFYDADGELLPAASWPAEAWRDAALDARLAEQVEAPAPDGLDDAIPTA